MVPTRRLWSVFALVGALSAFAVVFAQPLLLAGAVAVGAWIISRQYLFVRTITQLERSIDVDQQPGSSSVETAEKTPVTVTAALERPASVQLTVTAGLPLAATATDLSMTLRPGMTSGEATKAVGWPVAGRHRFQAAQVTVTDGLFRSTFPAGPSPTVTVEPPTPRGIHVGEGGEQVRNTYGNHDAGRGSSGITPAEIREYMPGDSMKNIDWKTTARLNTPHVRQYDAETDRVTYLLVDQSEPLAIGPPGARKLEFLREVALAVAASARRLDDPLGLCLFDDQSGGNVMRPASTDQQYDEIRRRLLELSLENTIVPDRGPSKAATLGAGATTTSGGIEQLAVSQATATDGAGEQDAFSQTLQAYAERPSDRLGTSSLSGAVKRLVGTHTGRALLVVFTDDRDQTELIDAVRTARECGCDVLLVLAPSVLFEPGGLTELEAAYERYVEFETLRRHLTSFDGVTALEVAPESRLATVLETATGRRRGERQ